MLIRCVIFVVLMMFWLLGGGYYVYGTPTPFAGPGLYATTFIPWACVALLGWCFFEKNPPSTKT